MGIPAIQLEIPRSVRNLIANSPKKIAGMATAILDLYWEVIVPMWWAKSSGVGPINDILADKLV